jgi:anti-sigma-K factor RskA
MINRERVRREIESLLPWHAAGTLSRSDAERVERALAEDRELAQRYNLAREEFAATINLNETLGTPSEWAKSFSLRSMTRRRGVLAHGFSALAKHRQWS